MWLSGYVGADPEVRTTAGGVRVARVSLATHEFYTDRESKERREITEWHRAVAFEGWAKVLGERVRKGDALSVTGRMKTRKWTDKKKGGDRWITEVWVDEIDLIGRIEKGPGKAATQQPAPEDPVPEEFDDDLPF